MTSGNAHLRSGGVPPLRAAGLLLMVTGIAVTLGGSFGPWLRSGQVERNSFQIVGALRRFPLIDNSLVRELIGAWPLLGPAMMIPLILAAFRLWRAAGIVAVILGVLAVAPSVTALVAVGTRSRLGIQLITTGPVTVIIGAVLLLAGGLMLLPGGRRPASLSTLRPGPPDLGTERRADSSEH